MYVDEKLSTYQIAAALNTTATKVRRWLLKYGIPLRDKGKAQANALASGRRSHPTKGRKRSEKEKLNISKGMAHAWSEIDEVERQRRVETAKRNWAAMSEEDRAKLAKAAHEAVRKTSTEGSSFERYILQQLRSRGIEVEFHRENIVPNEELQVDFYLPKLYTVIEIDGPAHFLPIWGEEKLAKHLAADQDKNGLLLQYGFSVIRIKNLLRDNSQSNLRKVFEELFKVIEIITKSDKSRNDYYEIEVS
jgi:very-short-patch-repair endonuclease